VQPLGPVSPAENNSRFRGSSRLRAGRRSSIGTNVPLHHRETRGIPERTCERGEIRKEGDFRPDDELGCMSRRLNPSAAASAHRPALRAVMRWVLATFYVLAGMLHLAIPDKFLLIVPDWVPLPYETVLFTGVCEIAGGVALLYRRTARL